MTARFSLTKSGAINIEAAGNAYTAAVAAEIEIPADAEATVSMRASIATEMVMRALVVEDDGDRRHNVAVIIGMGDGIGRVLGNIPDNGTRIAACSAVIQALYRGLNNAAVIHASEGNA